MSSRDWALFLDAETDLKTGNFKQALTQYQQISDLGADNYLLSHRLGYCLSKTAEFRPALFYLKQALSQKPEFCETHHSLAEIYTYHLIDYQQAKSHWEQYLQAFPESSYAWDILGHVLYQQLELTEALAAYERAFNLQSQWPTLQRLLYTSLRINPLQTHNDLAQQRVQDYLKYRDYPTYTHPGHKRKRLKIAYLSGDICQHAVAYALTPLLANHCRERFEVGCFSTGPQIDQLTNYCQTTADFFKDLSQLSAAEIAAEIYRARIDIVIELSGHTRHSALEALLYKPAPLQVSYLGYPGNTGISGIRPISIAEFKTSDSDTVAMAPPYKGFDKQRFQPYPTHRQSLPALSTGYLTLGSFNELGKLGPPVLSCWARILKRLPTAKLMVCRDQLKDSKQAFIRVCQIAGIDLQQIIFIADFQLQVYDQVDFVLDSFPYTGSTVNLDAAAMGVPVLTLAGEGQRGQEGAHINRLLGLKSWITQSLQAYEDQAVALAQDLATLASLRQSLPQRLQDSALRDHAHWTQNLEQALWQAWQNRHT